MPAPSYARATASSASKATPPSPSKTKDLEAPISIPRKIKRPSTLTPKHRQSITYKADLYPVRAQDPTKSCPLASLPSELRTKIYGYALQPDLAIQQPRFVCKARLRRRRYIWPKLLHISQAIRIEVAYLFYTSTPFIFYIQNFNFSKVVSWLEQLPPRHRALLTRNRNLSIQIMPGLRPSHTYPPKGFLLDNWMSEHWEACSAFGNLYTISSAQHQTHFILFCRLMTWFQLNSTMPYRNMTWRYDVNHSGFQRSIWDQCGDAETMWKLLSEEVRVVEMGCVEKTWTRGRVKGKGREEAFSFLSDLDGVFARVGVDSKEELLQMWASTMKRLKGVVNKW